jgi:hypothetical protein
VPILAHLGGLPIQESLIYLVPPLAIVGWIYALGRRERNNPDRPHEHEDEADDDDDEEPDDAP